jgi:predicted nucleotidyltransferase
MPYKSLASLQEKLKSSPRVKGVFTTGSTASKLTPYSDIDLVVILDKNTEGLKAVYTTIEQHFSDIFFFDVDFLDKVKEMREIPANGFEGMFVNWLLNGRIEYDPDDLLASLKKDAQKTKLVVPDSEIQDVLVRINYNLIANRRYFTSDDPTYHSALELRLLYSIIELVTAYFTLRGKPWQGEKEAIKFFSNNDPGYRELLFTCMRSTSLQEKMRVMKLSSKKP